MARQNKNAIHIIQQQASVSSLLITRTDGDRQVCNSGISPVAQPKFALRGNFASTKCVADLVLMQMNKASWRRAMGCL